MISSCSAFSRCLPLFFLCAFLFLAPIPCEGRTVYHVTWSGGAEPRNGLSWEHAFNEAEFVAKLADPALTDAEFWVAAGTYRPTTVSNRDASFVLRSGVALYGGFVGGETDFEQRNWNENRTVLYGRFSGSSSAYHVVRSGTNADETAVLDGFVVTGGRANGSSSADKRGGGLYNVGGSPTIRNCEFTGNSAEALGGGMFSNGGAPTFKDCLFRENTAVQGGAICAWGSGINSKVSGTLFVNNVATSGNGGAVFNDNGSPLFKDCVFEGNRATYGSGGGISNNSGSPVIEDSSFVGNSSFDSGGAFYNDNGSPLIAACLFLGNTANSGGAIRNHSGSPEIVNCTFSGNIAKAGTGGAFRSVGGNPTIVNCTFFGNSAVIAGVGGGGFFVFSGSPVVLNSIFWANSNGQIHGYGGMTTLMNSIVQEWSGEAVNIVSENVFAEDPLLGELQDNGGPTRTHALEEGSGALDRGLPVGERFAGGRSIRIPSADQRGTSRPQGEGVDIGAFECDRVPEEPSPNPEPLPVPKPSPTPSPETEPLPRPEPGPFPAPEPPPVPEPAPSPEPEPAPPPGHDPFHTASGGGCAGFHPKSGEMLLLLPLLFHFRRK